jgi:hypothetical protein
MKIIQSWHYQYKGIGEGIKRGGNTRQKSKKQSKRWSKNRSKMTGILKNQILMSVVTEERRLITSTRKMMMIKWRKNLFLEIK